MDSLIPILRPRQRVPMVDAGTLEGRTRPIVDAPIDARYLRLGLGAPAGDLRLGLGGPAGDLRLPRRPRATLAARRLHG